MKGLILNGLLICLWILSGSGIYAQGLIFDSLAVKAGFEKPLFLARAEYNNTFDKDNSSVGNMLAQFLFPADGKVISRFGVRSGRVHTGTDIKMRLGDTIYAAYNGVITCSQYRSGYGNLVVIQHEKNIETYYGHLSRNLVKAGKNIKAGEPIGLAGATGRATTTHLHFEIRENDRPYDPELVFNFENQILNGDVKSTEFLADLEDHNPEFNKKKGNSKKYVVQSGDSLWAISHRVKTSIESLCLLNNLTENSVIHPGQVLTVY